MKETFEKRIQNMEKCIENAQEYLKKGVNIEGQSAFHLDDWKGNSGHPKWVKNKMIPTMEKAIKKQEKLAIQFECKEKDKRRGRPIGRSHHT